MPFTREFIRKAAKESGVEIPKELEDALVNEHISTRDAYATTQVEKYKTENPHADPTPVKDTQEYKELKADFDNYKKTQDAKESHLAKEKAVRAYFESKGIKGSHLTLAMRGCKDEVGAVELDGDNIKDTAALDALISGDFADLVSTEEKGGASTKTPPPAGGTGKMSREDIVKIKDPVERREAIAANMEIFSKGNDA